ncbi:Putative vitellogenin receptor [Papilio xuthus]|uniref:Putative vitellogenin receptor n=1 Tax=Papilio xuthus TaxID=66420 RepID=A0A194Q0X1_PAPXU|nr:Putative vitellogenin receptor [Papilio xuthus]
MTPTAGLDEINTTFKFTSCLVPMSQDLIDLKQPNVIMVTNPIFTAVVREEEGTCSPGEVQCGDLSCVSTDRICDGQPDCPDREDEQFCDGASQSLVSTWKSGHKRSRRQATSNCRKNQWQCRDTTCINFDGKCDGIINCPDGSDETYPLCRSEKCQSNWFRCTYGACVDGTAPCNGIQECADNSDELLPRCRNETDEVSGQFKCDNGQLISGFNHCDGVADCSDGSDETVKACAAKVCPNYLFQCAYGACVDQGADCNGIKECADNSDESDELCNRISGPVTTTVKPLATGPCVLPPYPEHGSYVVQGAPTASPGQGFKSFALTVSCYPGYALDGSQSVLCFDGTWVPPMPKCIRYCKLPPHPSVEYRCLLSNQAGVEGSRPCKEYEPTGTVVKPECRRPNYYAAGTLPYMRCSEGTWDYTAFCTAGLIKNATNVTIIIKDNVQIHISQFQYASPITLVFPNSVQPIVDKPISVQPKPGNPIWIQFNEAESFTIQPDDVKPNLAQPISFQPNDVKPNLAQPISFQPNDVKPNLAQPISFQPNDVKPNLAQPISFQPNDVKPNLAQPDLVPFTNRPASVQSNNIPTSVWDLFTDRPIWPPLTTDLPNFLQIQPIKPKENSNENTDYDIDGNDWRIECGRVTPEGEFLIINGTNAERGELPWHAGIYLKAASPYMQICGGSLVTTNAVLSAAHCFWDDTNKQRPAELYAIAVGKLYRPWNLKVDVDAQKSDVKEIKIPPRFQGAASNYQDDIALVLLKTRIEYKYYVRPVCLDFDINFNRRQLQPNKLGKVAGWGLTSVNGAAAGVLQVVNIPYVSIEKCIANAPPGFREYITSDKICAGYGNGTALCKGDSGGGLAFPELDKGIERFYLRGIVSTAPSNENLCNANTLTTFTDLLSHEHFIKEHLQLD